MAQADTADPSPTTAGAPPQTTHTAANNDNDTRMPDASNDHTPNPQPAPPKEKEKEPHILHQTTFRHPPWTYFHLRLTSPSAPTSPTPADPDLSPLLVSPLLTSALRAYLGTTGAAIPVDILKTSGTNVWIRVPRQDARGVRAALSSWAGSVDGADIGWGGGRVGVAWRVGGQSGVLGVLGEGGSEVFG